MRSELDTVLVGDAGEELRRRRVRRPPTEEGEREDGESRGDHEARHGAVEGIGT
jgi:hypothetical protein